MSINRLLEDLELDGIENDIEFPVEGDAVEDILMMLDSRDDEGNLIPECTPIDEFVDTYGLDGEELIKELKECEVPLRFFDVTDDKESFKCVYVANEVCSEEDVKAKLESFLDDEEDVNFIVKEIKEEDKSEEEQPKEVEEEALKEEVKEGPSDIFGYINGDLKSFEPKEFIEKVKERKTSLHTNRVIKDTDNEKVCHHIVCECLGWGNEPKVWVDIVEETWTRNPGDADDFNSYKGEEKQERIVMENCGKGEEGFAKAIEVLEQYKKDTLAKNEELKEDVNALGKKFDEKDAKAIKRWWKKVEDLGKFNIDNGDGEDIEAMHAAMFDMLSDLEKEEDEESKKLLRVGKRLYNKYAISQF